MEKGYVETVRLLLAATPEVFRPQCFALKGGTALNLFVQEMPRLSVDLDVVYVPYAPERGAALDEIGAALTSTRERLSALRLDSEIVSTKDGDEVKLLVRRGQSQVKVEVNHVFRGTVLPVETRRLVKSARDLFTTELSAPVLAVAELYGGKLVAAMDRQHPRDLYDVREMYERFGLTAEIAECFVSYLAGHNRPIHEVLFSREIDMAPAFENEFVGMTLEPVTLAELDATRERLRLELPAALTRAQRQFLLSLAHAEPEWNLMSCPHLAELPALRWKLQNLAKLKKSNPRKLQQQADELRAKLAG
jgi:predicted nucleotidyltransferase component of viral defense system